MFTIIQNNYLTVQSITLNQHTQEHTAWIVLGVCQAFTWLVASKVIPAVNDPGIVHIEGYLTMLTTDVEAPKLAF